MTASRTAETTHLEVERVFSAQPRRVFDAWTRPEALKAWFGPPGCDVDAVQVDLRVGGALSISLVPRAFGVRFTITGVFTEIEAPRWLAFTWNILSAKGICPTLVKVRFEGTAAGTRVNLRQELLPDAETLEAQRRVIECCLDQLEALLARS